MSDRTFRLILDGKKGGLVKGSTPSSAAKKACKKLLAEQMKNSSVFHQLSLKDKVLKTEPGKNSFKFELQETTKDSKKKVYGPYKGCLVKDKIKVKMAGGVIPFSLLSTNSENLPPSNVLQNKHVNLNYNFSGVSQNDLSKQLIALNKIKQRIHKLRDEFSKKLGNKKPSEPPKNTKINKSNINFENYNLQDSLARGDIEQKFYELSHFYEKINKLISRIQETLEYTHNEKNKVYEYYQAIYS